MNFESENLETVYHAALELPEPERTRYLASACDGDTAFRHKVELLLAAGVQADSFFSKDPLQLVSADQSAPFAQSRNREQIGDVIDRYKILEKIGEGGCGVVYLSEQREPVKRRVALKIIKLGMDTKQVVARFEAERQALAMMDHPNIARVFDGGATENGRPYFVMELVRGVPITKYCDENQLSTRERLDLFLRVCEAVQHAHQKGIIHRDLKPSNILITINDGTAVPKVIDFGIAKATQGKLSEDTIHTSFHQLIGTPAYMSPEQALITSEDIDTRSDIYSLGVLLYELLTGKPPFDNHELLTAGVDEMRRIIREMEPIRPSQALRVRAQKELSTLHSALSTDLDWIVMKCLEKDRTRRYETANGLAADLHRHLNNEPVLARPPSTTYRIQKMLRRHRSASLAIALVTCAVLSGAILSTWALIRENAARKQSDQRLQSALRFVDEIFTGVASEIRRMPDAVKAQEKLGQASLRILQDLRAGAGEDPTIKEALAKALIHLSRTEGNIGEGSTVGNYEAGLRRAREAAELLSPTPAANLGPNQLQLLVNARHLIASALSGLGRFDEAVIAADEIGTSLTTLERFPEFREWARTRRMVNLANAGYCCVGAGRAREGLGKYLLPVLKSEWAQSISTNSSESNIEVLANTYGQLAAAHESLNDFVAMTEAADKGIPYQEILVQRFPGNTRHAGCMAGFRRVRGHGLIHAGRTNEGWAALNQSRTEIEDLLKKDPANEFVKWWRAYITSTHARAFAVWSKDTAASVLEREERLLRAQSCFVEAEEFTSALKGKHEILLKAARGEIRAAKAMLASNGGTEPEHPLPATPSD